ncbi:MAG TPA: DUF3422 domain-containing protein [Usitatibacter sp.]|nr:DUF3422 domain-containing protein [Usitatibacter sp.]
MSLPESHALRFELAGEVHARPHEALVAPLRASHVAVLVDAAEREREHAHVARLCREAGVTPPEAGVIHFSADLGSFRLRWERHTEFSSYSFFCAGVGPARFAQPVASRVPGDWLRSIPGRTLTAAHAEFLDRSTLVPPAREIAAAFEGNYVIGSEVGDGAAAAFTDFRIHADGFGRFLVIDRSLSRFQAGRTLQRLFEIEAYRMMALLALPIARETAPRLAAMERDLAAVALELARGDGQDDALLDHLTKLSADVESAIAASRFRFGATRAYHDLVDARIRELRERRLPGTQTIEEFMARRLAPAMATCESVSKRLLELSERVAQSNSLLVARVDVVHERQNQQLLASMDRRARLQLRLQETVEGLSVVAITYYMVGLVGYAAKALKAAGYPIDPDLTSGIAIAVVAVLATLGVRYVRRTIEQAERAGRIPD